MGADISNDYRARILRVLVHIQRHLDDALDLESLAAIAHFSPYHFHRIFRGMVGEPVAGHVRRLRLERAANRLKFGDQPVTRIAFDAGYETHEAFTRAFSAMFGIAPSKYRAERRSAAAPQAISGVHYIPEQPDQLTFEPRGETEMDVSIEHCEPQRVAFVRHIGPYDQVGPAWGRLMQWAGMRGLLGPHMRLIGITRDDPDVTPPDRIRYDACIQVGDDVQADGDIGIDTIAGGDYATATHRGPYDKLGETYAEVCGRWLPQSGRELRSEPGFEVYLNNPNDTAPQDLLTEIHVPLAPPA